MVTTLTIDTSVAVKWVVDEPGSRTAAGYLPIVEGNLTVIRYHIRAPALIALELHHTLSRRCRKNEATFEQLAEAEMALRYLGGIDPLTEELINNARFMSFIAKHREATAQGRPRPHHETTFNIYDCVFIAHARQNKSTLLTADKEQASVARAFGVPVEFVPVG